jgi:4-carboxymuconolactone decarboxylase
MRRVETLGLPGTLGTILLLLGVIGAGVRAQERMLPIAADKMTDAQKKAVADYKALRGTDMTGPPWTVLLRVPAHVVPALQIRLHYLNGSVLGPRLTEFAILIAARRWTNNWEWNAHSTAAASAGLKSDVMAAVAEGRRPDRMAEDEALVYDFSLELQDNQSVSDSTYARALDKFGEPGIVEMASIQGYYTYLAMVMSAARVTVPPNAKPALERFPRLGQGLVEK